MPKRMKEYAGSAVLTPRETARRKDMAVVPSTQYLRSPLGKSAFRSSRTSRTRFATRILTLSLAGALGLSACGTQKPDAAAIVNGTSISDESVQEVTTEINKLAQVQQKLTPSIVLNNLILAPYVLAEADRAGNGATDAQARKIVAKITKPSRSTLDFVRMQLSIQSLTPASTTAILTKLRAVKITVNPRYGTFNAKTYAIGPNVPNWIKAGPAKVAK